MTFDRASKKTLLAALFAAMIASACQPAPTATLTPRPTATKPVLLPTPTAVVASQVEGQVVGTVGPSPTFAPVAANITSTPTRQVITVTVLPSLTPAPGALPATATHAPATATITATPVPGATKTSTPTITNTPPPNATATSTPTNTDTPTRTPTPQNTATTPPQNTPTATSPAASSSIFGVELATLNTAGGLPQAKTLGAKWLRRNGLVWSDIEPSEDARNWGAASALEQELRDASAQGFEVILIVRSAPAWAQLAGKKCGPIRPDKNAAFAAFLHDAVARYSVAPYNVKYWEIWNEPDADPAGFGGNEEFGCMGDPTDEFYGGGAYGNLLKAAYPQIKSASPAAQVLFGGLLLDCDPITPPTGKNCQPAKFLEGALRAGAGPYFDGVSFHAYDYYSYADGKFGNSNWGANWNTTGPVTLVKARFIREALNRYAAGDKFLINTEGSLILFNGKNTSDSLEYTKADYAIKMYTVCMAEKLRACVWYSMKGWNFSGLVNASLEPGYPFRAIQFLIPRLQNATFVTERTGTAGVKAYEFLNTQGKRILIAWSADGATRSLTLEAVPAVIYDLFGTTQIRSQTVNLTEAPFIIELN